VPASLAGRRLPGPVLVAVTWVTDDDEATVVGLRLDTTAVENAVLSGCRSFLLVTNGDEDRASRVVVRSHQLPLPPADSDANPLWLDAGDIGRLLDEAPELRRRIPFVLGVRNLSDLVSEHVRSASTWDEAAARELARVFVPTRAYRRTLRVLEQHRFAVLTGPPEMGKTAIARTLGLALQTEGWEVHECIRPDQVWSAFAPGRPQLFVADDAFGSTEYRPDAAERWALELDRILQALDDRHWLVWTSRPAPLKAGLARVHREHGVERFPQPAQVHVDAAALDLEEKALILYRHARATNLPSEALALVREHGVALVEHEHFTPERIRRFVRLRLLELTFRAASPGALSHAIERELSEPTEAMAASLEALPPEHRALLVAMLDQPPGPVPERELAHAARRLAPAGLPRAPADLVDRLTDHFLRIVPPTSVTWVHPSWRDLVIEHVAADAEQRRHFLESCSVEGLMLGLSRAGGRTGERSRPLLVDDADWDTAAQRIHELVPELDEDDVLRLLGALEAFADANAHDRTELLALTTLALHRLEACWRNGSAIPEPSLLERWFELAAMLPDPPEAPALSDIWQSLVPPAADLVTIHDVERYRRWLRISALLEERTPGILRMVGFPENYGGRLQVLLEFARDEALVAWSPTLRDALAESLFTLADLDVRRAEAAIHLARTLPRAAVPRAESEAGRFASPSWFGAPFAPDTSIVGRILADLRP
jgi:hypothetical protein